jgi:transposase, IS5 family
VMESNVNFPSDISLLWDSARKCIDIMIDFEKKYQIGGWRKAKDWYRKLKNQFRALSKTCQSGGKDKEKKEKEKAGEYLRLARELNDKIVSSKGEICTGLTISQAVLRLKELDYYHSMLTKHIDLVERRLIKGETIPHGEKLFSIFEPHAEWIKKGKSNNKVEIGHNILVATDQFDFILTHKVIEKQADVELSIPLTDVLLNLYPDIFSISFDKGFWKKSIKNCCSYLLKR